MEGATGITAAPSAEGRNPLRMFGPQPRLTGAAAGAGAFAGAGAGIMASVNLGGGGGGGAGSGGEPPADPIRPERGGAPPGQERTISFQPEERYWTDYLRILLPVAGLLILIGLLWWWLNYIIGDTSSEPPVTPTTQVAIDTDATETIDAAVASPTPLGTPRTVQVTQGPPPTPTPPPAAPAAGETPPVAPAAGDETATGDPTAPAGDAGDCSGTFSEYAPGTTVLTTETVNVRQSASTTATAITQVAANTPVEISGPFENFPAPACDWWPVTVNGTEGFIREDFLRAADQ